METTVFLSKLIGPVLLLRGASIAFDRKHFYSMVAGLEKEITTVSFSMFPVALLMACIAIEIHHADFATPAGILIHLMAWGGMAKATALILFPALVVAKARFLVAHGFLLVVGAACAVLGLYFSWVGYLA